jgi:hypothetical protein
MKSQNSTPETLWKGVLMKYLQYWLGLWSDFRTILFAAI